MKTNQDRIDNLIEYVQGLMNKEDGKELYLKYRSDIEGVTPQEVFRIFYSLLQKDIESKEVLTFLDKVINVFYKSLSNYSWEWPEKNSFMDYLIRENHALIGKLEEIKELIKEGALSTRREVLLPRICELQQFNAHYLKKENILFPFMEKKMEKFNGLSIMWELQDETRAQLEKTIQCLEARECSEEELNAELGKLFFAMYGLVKKEELILFPAASEVINESEWHEMQRQSLEYEFPFIEKPQLKNGNVHGTAYGDAGEPIIDYYKGCRFKTETGALDFEQLLMLFNALPLDLTFVDENNKVRYFTKPKERIFPRSPAIIGRDVEKCHPPQSVHVVKEIIESFRAGKQDSATFWINLKGRTLLIQYFALRDSSGNYRGVLEASQDITEIKKLEGERRLLQWEK